MHETTLVRHWPIIGGDIAWGIRLGSQDQTAWYRTSPRGTSEALSILVTVVLQFVFSVIYNMV